MYVANYGSGTVTAYDTATDTELPSGPVEVSTGSTSAGPTWLTVDGSTLYVADSFSSTVSVIDTVSGALTATVPLSGQPAEVVLAGE